MRLITGPQDPYKWASLPEKRYLFEKHLSKHCTRAYREICVGVGEAFEAVPTDVNNNETHPSAEILEARPEKTSDLEVAKKPAGSFTAKIDELERQNLALMTELEQWRSTASNVEALNQELGASLEEARLSVNALQQEKEHMCSYKPDPLPNDRESTADIKHFTWILFSIRLFLDILFVARSSPRV